MKFEKIMETYEEIRNGKKGIVGVFLPSEDKKSWMKMGKRAHGITRKYIEIYVNGKRVEIADSDIFLFIKGENFKDYKMVLVPNGVCSDARIFSCSGNKDEKISEELVFAKAGSMSFFLAYSENEMTKPFVIEDPFDSISMDDENSTESECQRNESENLFDYI